MKCAKITEAAWSLDDLQKEFHRQNCDIEIEMLNIQDWVKYNSVQEAAKKIIDYYYHEGDK